ncbi:hypothetical protein TYRP_022446 [Tyrophagus putrescentiae]|nr:hypothetical protein TYRP_022446 [Tyrophagus putrescentiae]
MAASSEECSPPTKLCWKVELPESPGVPSEVADTEEWFRPRALVLFRFPPLPVTTELDSSSSVSVTLFPETSETAVSWLVLPSFPPPVISWLLALAENRAGLEREQREQANEIVPGLSRS